MGGDGSFQPLDGCGHSRHQERIVEMSEFGVQECTGLTGRGDAASDQQFRKHRRNPRGFGQGRGFFGVRVG
jgi:hypothetical protein